MERLVDWDNDLYEPRISLETATSSVGVVASHGSGSIPTLTCEPNSQFLTTLLQIIPVPLVICRIADGTILYANEHYHAIFRGSRETNSDRAPDHPEQENRINLYHNPGERQILLHHLASQGYIRDWNVRVQGADGTLVWSIVSLQWLSFNREQVLLAVFHGITPHSQTGERLLSSRAALDCILSRECQSASAELKLVQSIIQAINEAPDCKSALYVALQKIGQATYWDVGEAWIQSPNSNTLERITTCIKDEQKGTGITPTLLHNFFHHRQTLTLTPGMELPGRVWVSRQMEWISNTYHSSHLDEGEGFRSALAVPIIAQDQVLAVLTFFKAEPYPEDWRLTELIATIATLLGVALKHKQAAEALRSAEAKYRSIFENALEGIFQTTVDGHYLSANPALARLYGYSTPEELMARLTDIEHQLYVDPHRRNEFIHLLQENDAVSDFESQVYRKDRSIIWIAENARAVRATDTGELLYYEGTVEDITERKLAKEQLHEKAFYDSLTGLPNRALFMDRLGQAVERAKRHLDYRFAVLFLDLDRFKVVNDSLGHLIGDQLLIAIARRLEACLRTEDTVGRLGGDEFTILLENIQQESDATTVAQRIQQELIVPFNLEGHEVFTGASIGIVLSREVPPGVALTDYDQPQDLLRDADTALYRAKALGRTRYEVFDATMHQNAVTTLKVETDLRRAVENQEFLLHYQPIISLTTHQIIGFEALLRWQHPTKGLVYPDEFMTMAEETGLMVPLGWWILRESCRQLKQWQQGGLAKPIHGLKPEDLSSLSIHINLTTEQFLHPELPDQIAQILQQVGLDGSHLKLEITEQCLLENPDAAATLIKQLKRQNIQLCIDDFGTGYSSLNYLHRFPIDSLKIDRSVIHRLGIEEINNRANVPQDVTREFPLQIVETMLMLAHNLGMNVIAEGVETIPQLNQLKALNCQYAQGYLFQKPVDALTLSSWLAEWENGMIKA